MIHDGFHVHPEAEPAADGPVDILDWAAAARLITAYGAIVDRTTDQADPYHLGRLAGISEVLELLEAVDRED